MQTAQEVGEGRKGEREQKGESVSHVLRPGLTVNAANDSFVVGEVRSMRFVVAGSSSLRLKGVERKSGVLRSAGWTLTRRNEGESTPERWKCGDCALAGICGLAKRSCLGESMTQGESVTASCAGRPASPSSSSKIGAGPRRVWRSYGCPTPRETERFDAASSSLLRRMGVESAERMRRKTDGVACDCPADAADCTSGVLTFGVPTLELTEEDERPFFITGARVSASSASRRRFSAWHPRAVV